ncbi:MAG: TonB family protein [Bacteroidetes bacterium]|nr:TonB family protein [Bacteroidota bacterium]
MQKNHQKYFLLLLFLCPIILSAQEGTVKGYYPDGKIKAKLSYVNEILDGTCYYYYHNGNLESEKTFSAGKLNGWVYNFYETGLLMEDYSVQFGIRDGLTKLYYENGGLKEVLSYESGELVKRINIDYDSTYAAPLTAYAKGNKQNSYRKKVDQFICEAEECPQPLGGMEDIMANLVYPEHAKLYGLEGFVTIIATVNELGTVTNTEIVQGLGLGCDEAAIDAVKKTKFLPGANGGRPVTTRVIFKIEFKLGDKIKISAGTIVKQQEAPLVRISELLETPDESSKIGINEIVPHGDLPNEEQPKSVEPQVPLNFECNVDKCPRPIGGLNAILKNLVVPQRVIRLKLEGEVIVEAEVDKYGLVRDTKVLQKMGHGADEAVEVAILNTQFEPGILNGEIVRTSVIVKVPIIKPN